MHNAQCLARLSSLGRPTGDKAAPTEDKAAQGRRKKPSVPLPSPRLRPGPGPQAL